jgi:hypothetical protein
MPEPEEGPVGLEEVEHDPVYATIFSEQDAWSRTQSDNSTQRGGERGVSSISKEVRRLNTKYKNTTYQQRYTEQAAVLRELLDRTDKVRDLREKYDTWLGRLEGKAIFLEKQVGRKSGVGFE